MLGKKMFFINFGCQFFCVQKWSLMWKTTCKGRLGNMGIPTYIKMKNTHLKKFFKIQPPDLLFVVVLYLAFTSGDIIFHKCLELHPFNII